MTKLIPMEKLSEAFEWDDRLGDLCLAKGRLANGSAIRVEITAPDYQTSTEIIDKADAPYVFDAIKRYLTEIEDSLSSDIRALGLEPTKRDTENFKDDDDRDAA